MSALTATPRRVVVLRPPYGDREELHVLLPCGHACALIPEVHSWTGDGSTLTVSPSIVCHAGDYHGFFVDGSFR